MGGNPVQLNMGKSDNGVRGQFKKNKDFKKAYHIINLLKIMNKIFENGEFGSIHELIY